MKHFISKLLYKQNRVSANSLIYHKKFGICWFIAFKPRYLHPAFIKKNVKYVKGYHVVINDQWSINLSGIQKYDNTTRPDRYYPTPEFKNITAIIESLMISSLYDLLHHGIEFFKWDDGESFYYGCQIDLDDYHQLMKSANDYFIPGIHIENKHQSTIDNLQKYIDQIKHLRACLKLK